MRPPLRSSRRAPKFPGWGVGEAGMHELTRTPHVSLRTAPFAAAYAGADPYRPVDSENRTDIDHHGSALPILEGGASCACGPGRH